MGVPWPGLMWGGGTPARSDGVPWLGPMGGTLARSDWGVGVGVTLARSDGGGTLARSDRGYPSQV